MYRTFSYASSKVKWDPKNALQNFINMCQSEPKTLFARVSPLNLISMTPLIHQGMLGVENKKEAAAAVNTWSNIAGAGIGLTVATIPVIRFFTKCLQSASVRTCTETTVNDLLSYSAIPLLAGALLTSLVAKTFIITPLFTRFAQDPTQETRVLWLNQEYKKMLTALNSILDKPANDPKFQETVTLASQFLSLSPHIEETLHTSLSLDREQAKELVLPLQTACLHFQIKHAIAEAAKLDRATLEQLLTHIRQILTISPQAENELYNALSLDKEQAKEFLAPLQVACRDFLAKKEITEKK
jgi:hypothetical protein